MPDQPRRRTTRMTLPEAERIVELDREGVLDRSDDDVAKVVFEAHTVVQRSAMWGSSPGHPARRKTVLIVVGAGLFIGTWIVGLLTPLLLGTER
ncbi:hypothetical protein [Frondihabitans sp. 762G35]|uniref:hypothetical protein n=1 Tax=Frondihabitans sp. 762G35 TaxID=1446794 RepID=UPI000F4DEFEF|nr:hypothetical protein [Frondihabitans sp. 762G35]